MYYVKMLFSILQHEILNFENVSQLIDFDCDFAALYSLAKEHDLAHLIYPYFQQNGITVGDDELNKRMKSAYNAAVFRDVNREVVRNAAFKILNNSGIDYVPLKGALIAPLYPETWMRTSCDIDILVHEADIEKALDVLSENGFETNRERSYHDVSLRKDGIHIELHYNICENLPRIDCVLEKVWDYCTRFNNCEYRENCAFFVFHHIAHMCYHFIHGGCGIKPFVDLYLIKSKLDFSETELMSLLEQGGLVDFYKKVCELTDVWFGEARHDTVTLAMERFILDGGVFGNLDNNNIMRSAYNDNKLKNFINIVFPPYKTMCNTYPVLRKFKILLPFYYIKRIFAKLTGSGDRVVGRMTNLASQDNEVINNAAELLNELGLK